MKSKPCITIVTVCFNSVETIKDTLESVSLQSYSNFEHLIIDGGLSDGTLELLRSWRKHAVRLIAEPDDGIYDAMNKGLGLATGDVLGFLNSDDFYQDEHVLGKVAEAFSNPLVDVCYGDLLYISQDKKSVVRYWKSKDFVSGDFAKGWCPAHPTFYVRKSKIDQLGLFDLSYKLAADVEFMMRYLEDGHLKSVYIPEVLVRMRVGGATNQSWRNIVKQNKEVLRALRKNGIKFSVFLFFVSKIFSRFGQFANARFKRYL